MKSRSFLSGHSGIARIASIASIALLIAALFSLSTVRSQPQTQPPTQTPPAPLTEEEKARRIAALEKQIADTQAQLAELKKTPTVPSGVLPEKISAAFPWRCIGPSNMGGRITAIAVNEKDPSNYWVATASGGLLCTRNNGITFDFQFDNQSTVSIGDVAVSPSHPNIVWVGTGEANPRNSVSYGDGVYKSTDGGKSFKNMGLNKTFQIGRIEIHPTNPDIVYVGALGRLYGPNPERGVFKTTDGGKTWTHVLKIDDNTGCIDLRIDPNQPETLIAAMWERRRDAFDGYFGISPVPDMYGPAITHGPGGGLWKTRDGGKTWTRLNDKSKPNGLPTVRTGRIGLDHSRKTPGLIFAIIDTEKVGTGPLSQVYFGSVIDSADGAAKLTELTKDGPAQKAGLKNGDLVQSIDGERVRNADEFIQAFSILTPGTVIKLKILREGQEQEIAVTLGKRENTAAPPTPLAGFRFAPGSSKPIVEAVVDNHPADRAGMLARDEITAVDGKPVATVKDYTDAIKSKKPLDTITVTVRRGKDTHELKITLAAANQGGRGQTLDRPYGMGLGGQKANMQNPQGADGYQTGGVYLSRDFGDTWTRVNSLNPRPMYYCVVRVDPNDDNTIYVLGDTPSPLWRSTNGGKTMSLVMTASGVHADAHALWINPRDSRHLIIGCDGGFYCSYDRGERWEHLNHLALGQFYHVCVDSRKPYNVYGGLQDNGSWGGPSDTLRRTGPVHEDWKFIAGGDGFVCRTDPIDPDWVYTESQGGFMTRRNLRTGESGVIRAPYKETEPALRFNWNTPYILSQHNPSIFYCGAQYVYKSVKRGDDLKPISPELTRSKAGSLTAIAESPRNADVLWAGSDDGLLWITRDGGAKWENVIANVQKSGLPKDLWVAAIETSRVEPGRAYVTFDAHRSDDDRPYILVTEDFGATWKPLHKNLPPFGSTRVCREDIVNPNILYAGTEFGAFVSIDRGGHWTKLGQGLPTVACHEFAQPTTANDLVVGTHGRSVWVLDITAIRQMTPLALQASAVLFAPSPAIRWKINPSSESAYSRSDHKFFGSNPPRGAQFDILIQAKAKKVSLSVFDVKGALVWKMEDPNPNRRSGIPLTEPGLHRVNWNLTTEKQGPGGRRVAVNVPPGNYRVVLNVDEKEYVQSLAVELDPNAPKDLVTTDDDLEETEKARKARRIELRLDN